MKPKVIISAFNVQLLNLPSTQVMHAASDGFCGALLYDTGGSQLMFAGKRFQMFPKDRELNQILGVKVK